MTVASVLSAARRRLPAVAVPRMASRARRGRGALASAAAVLTVLAGSTQALADEPAADPAWTAASPTVFGIGDSLFMQCGETLGLGTRSLGMIGWGHGTTQDMRTRLTSTAAEWPYMTEPSHAEELANFHNASTWVIGLGTNDVRGAGAAAQFQANVTWFMQQASGRPVLWFNLHYPAYQADVDTYNGILDAAAQQWPNLRILDWHGYVGAHPEVVSRDGIHLASYAACRQGRFAMTQAAVPPVTGQTAPDPAWSDPAPQALPVPDPVAAEYERTGAAAGPLGAATGAVTCEHKRDGCIQFFAKGAIAWSPATGAHVMSKGFADGWVSQFSDTGRVGYPTAAAACGLVRGGCRQQFEAGWMYWSARTGGRELMNGPILTRYRALGAERSILGYPAGQMACNLAKTGCAQTFQYGSIYWNNLTGTRVIFGAVRSRWLTMGAGSSVMGYPTSDTRCGLRAGGCGQHFTGGSIYWSARTGARVVGLSVRTRYLATRAQDSGLGYPTSDTSCSLRGGGCGQTFQGGSIYATSRTAAAKVVAGVIRSRWLALGGVNSRYGYPIAEQRPIAGGYTQQFQRGTLTYRNGRWV